MYITEFDIITIYQLDYKNVFFFDYKQKQDEIKKEVDNEDNNRNNYKIKFDVLKKLYNIVLYIRSSTIQF